MQDLLEVPNLHIGNTTNEILAGIDELLALETDSISYEISHLYKTKDALYSEQLLAFLSADR